MRALSIAGRILASVPLLFLVCLVIGLLAILEPEGLEL